MKHFPSGQRETSSESDDNDEALRSLGEELYELFAGRRPFRSMPAADRSRHPSEDDSDDSEEGGNRQHQQRRKKGKGPELRTPKFVRLSELGLPVSLCDLVSSLLDTSSSNVDSSGGYNSFKEVEEDLRLMVDQPRILFGQSDSDGKPVIPTSLNIPENVLYGRDAEVAQLLEAFERTVSNDCFNNWQN
mmetsp:Transcript_62389/g.184609  ORF Transcript_62389/g.184609 Transcript_62389/m.184609 type:complete len:189 (+) Transcript_62389:718-1284(+)